MSQSNQSDPNIGGNVENLVFGNQINIGNVGDQSSVIIGNQNTVVLGDNKTVTINHYLELMGLGL